MRNGQAYQQKMEKFSVSEEKKFGRIDSRFCALLNMSLIFFEKNWLKLYITKYYNFQILLTNSMNLN